MRRLPPFYKILRLLAGKDAERFPLERKLRFFQLRYCFSVGRRLTFSARQSAALFGAFAIPPLMENQTGKTATARAKKFLSCKENRTFYSLCFPKNQIMKGVFSELANCEANDIKKRDTEIRNSKLLFDAKFALATYDYDFGFDSLQRINHKLFVGVSSDGFKHLFPYHQSYMSLIYAFSRNGIETFITHFDAETFHDQFVKQAIPDPSDFERMLGEWIYITEQVKGLKGHGSCRHLPIESIQISPELSFTAIELESLGFKRHINRYWL